MLKMVRTCLFGLILLGSACGPPPASLTAPGIAAFRGRQVVRALDVIRDTAVDGNAAVPPVFSTATTNKIVTFHKSAVLAIDQIPKGWKSTVLAGLDQLKADLSPAEWQLIAPWVAAATLIIQEAL